MGPGVPPGSIDRYEPRFLLWLWEKTDGALGVPVSSAGFGAWQSIPDGVVWAVVDRLRGHALIRTHGGPRREGHSEDVPQVSFEAAGVQQAHTLQVRRADPTERARYTRKAVLDWIFAQADRGPLRIEEFFDSAGIFFLGEALARGEVARAAAYLADAGLIDCDGPRFHDRVGSYVVLTQLGVDAVLTGSDVFQYVERQRERARPSGGPVFHAPVHGYVNRDLTVGGDLTIQQVLTPAELAELVAQFASALAPDTEQRAALLRSADALRLQGGDGSRVRPDQHQGPLERVRAALSGLPDTVGREMLLDAVGQTMGRLLG
ncbi:hypothetical protein LHJ74_19680 [Streptomyces sp. N2-109]|uniref:Uncharacterized protein n=1 Tax=Streptomyces gossypii TaxID=2883101 RepID=A0ABT2JW85_9ACTN|nr:hypothetical protein [Streptomyces gossypii]MCT2592096.1 hypothetical protein [Streptomyces gossypii]